jgi:hypothetical protein
MVIISVFLAGCANNKNPDDFNIDGLLDETSASVEDAESTEEKSKAESTVWNDEFDVNTSSALKEIQISAVIKDSDTETVSVVTMQEPEFDEEYKKAMAEAIFGAGDIYIYGDEVLTKSEVEERISDTNEQIEDINKSIQEQGEWFSEDKQEFLGEEEADEKLAGLEETLEEYQAMLGTAPEEHVKADDYSSNGYMSKYGGINYSLEFDDTRDGIYYKKMKESIFYSDMYSLSYRQKYICFRPLDFHDVCSDELNGYDAYLWPLSDNEFGSSEFDDLENICTTSKEDAILTAKQFAAQIGFSDLEVAQTSDCIWMGAADEYWEDSKAVKDGYVVLFEHNIDGHWLEDDVEDYYEVLRDSSVEDPQYQIKSYLKIYVNDYGIVNMECINPLTEIQKTEDVPMISLDNVQEIITDALKNDTDKYAFDEYDKIQNFRYMNLVYFRLHSSEEDGIYSYVPAWMLYEQKTDNGGSGAQGYGAVIVVNAIDGSIIDVKKELFGE